ncbi:hypothetical protein EC973_004012 [Apophysomyces ossiformis]|uniref:BZIP domain-containing protein n=1 Tax=Apophysomyces ossiformis TaxID=679940 RepID=A0A8H7BXR9_9FUNG|nr:hypothetical protein EC973_004012 [Apophysomyces ossiformis]
MSLSMPIPSSGHQYHAKPMAISSITSPRNASLASPSCSSSSSSSSSSSTPNPTKPPATASPTGLYPSLPSSPELYPHHPPQPYQHHPPSHTALPRYHGSQQSHPVPPTYNATITPSSPLSLQERRQRNKAASAKYRAKKNQQHGEMRSMIGSLTKENQLLQRELEQIRRENSQLKTTCDRLRGKMMAEKMLKRMLGRNSPENGDLKVLFHSTADNPLHISNRFEEDIEFDDNDDNDGMNEHAWSSEAKCMMLSPADVEMKNA